MSLDALPHTPEGKGLFIAFEGVEGSGKSTQAEMLQAWFKRRDLPVLRTREPGGTPLGSELRKILLHDPKEQPGPMEELMMFLLDRQVHLRKVILPQVSRGTNVITDRYHYSTLAYQEPDGKGLTRPWQDVSWHLIGNIRPHLAVILDVEPDQAFKRIPAGSLDKIERRGREYFARVRGRFMEQAQMDPQRFLVLDAMLDRDTIASAILRRVEELLK